MVQKKKQDEPKLTGALVSVLILGGFIVLSWVGVFAIFVSRNG